MFYELKKNEENLERVLKKEKSGKMRFYVFLCIFLWSEIRSNCTILKEQFEKILKKSN